MNTTHKMFAKIRDNFSLADWSKFKSTDLVESFYSEQRKGGSYFYNLQNLDEFLKLHKGMFDIMPNKIFYCEFTGSGLVTPHRDKLNTVAMNLYLETDNATTIYYEEIIPDTTASDIKYIKPASPPIENLIEVGRFTAQPQDLYLLDVNEVHGILKTTDKPRSMISYRWKNMYSFNEIFNSLNI